MAGFCTKCGASVPSATGFCPTCGAPIGSPLATPASQPSVAAAAPPVAPPSAYGQPPAAGAYAPPPKSGGGALKIILIVIAVVVGLGVIGAGIVGYGIYKVAHSVQTDNKGNGTISLPGVGAISAGKNVDVSAADLGVPLYPGAIAGEGGMRMTLPTGSVMTAVYVTSDPVSSVVAFYKGTLGANESDIDTANGSVLTSGSQGANGKSGIEITVGPGTGNNSGKTQFVVMHTTSTQ
jgi:hypothetical protein